MPDDPNLFWGENWTRKGGGNGLSGMNRIVIENTKSHFHTTFLRKIPTYLYESKIFYFLLNSRNSEFKSARLKLNSFTFCKNTSFMKSFSETNLSLNKYDVPFGPVEARTRLCPFETIFN